MFPKVECEEDSGEKISKRKQISEFLLLSSAIILGRMNKLNHCMILGAYGKSGVRVVLKESQLELELEIRRVPLGSMSIKSTLAISTHNIQMVADII